MAKINARQKGKQFELDIIKWFNSRGYNSVSSRSESKRTDDAGVDLCYTKPFNVQCKAVEKLGSIHDIIKGMPNDTNYNLVFHKKNRKGVMVTMSMEDFGEILDMLITNQIIKP
jgi:hypothetical protein